MTQYLGHGLDTVNCSTGHICLEDLHPLQGLFREPNHLILCVTRFER